MSTLRLEAVAARHRDTYQEMAREFRKVGDERFADALDRWETHLEDVERFARGLDLPVDRVPERSHLAIPVSHHGFRAMARFRIDLPPLTGPVPEP